MSLLDLQRAMRDDILTNEDATAPGQQVYRLAYRNRLLSALQESFALTRRWVSDEAFDAAACHHIILNPPTSWTLDDYGAGFDQTLRELFADDPEVAELAWLEWHMQRAFAAPNSATINAAMLTSGELAMGDWETVRFTLVPSFAMRKVATDCVTLWQALADGEMPTAARLLSADSQLIVWRQAFSPHFRIVEAMEGAALGAIAAGQEFGALCAALADELGPETAMAQAGVMLGRWVQDGLIAGIRSDNSAVRA